MSGEDHVFLLADGPSIVQAQQKDNYIESIVRTKFEDFLKSLGGQLFTSRYSQEISIVAKVLYLGLTSLRNKRTLGEEYVDLIYVNRKGTGLIRKWKKLLFIISYAILPYYLSRFFNRVKSMLIKSEKDEESNKLLSYLGSMSFKDMLDSILNFHLLIFYLSGKFYQLSKRIFGMRYAIAHDVTREEKQFRNSSSKSYRVLGGLIVLQMAVKLMPRITKFVKSHRKQDSERAPIEDGVLTGIPPTSSTTCINLSDPDVLPFIPKQSRKCILCLVEMVDPSCLPCGHLFCWKCISQWCNHRQECPLCRQRCTKQSILPIC